MSDHLTIDCIRKIAYGNAEGLAEWDSQKAASMLLDTMQREAKLRKALLEAERVMGNAWHYLNDGRQCRELRQIRIDQLQEGMDAANKALSSEYRETKDNK